MVMTEQDRRNIEAVRCFYQAEREVAADDLVWHVPGHTPVSGVYRGRSECFDVLPSRMAPLTVWDIECVVSWGMATSWSPPFALQANKRAARLTLTERTCSAIPIGP